jgi:hypothetical protein
MSYCYKQINGPEVFSIYSPIIPIITTTSINDFFYQLSSIQTGEKVQVIDVNSFIYPYVLKSNIQSIPEFRIISQAANFFVIERTTFLTNKTNESRLACCLSSVPYYINNNVLVTCDPLSKDFVVGNYCDRQMLNYCFNNLSIPKCLAWLYYAMNRIELEINPIMQVYCTNNIFTSECKVYIEGLRKKGSNILADSILTNAWNTTKDSRLNCSFDTYYNHKVNAPKVCWSYECMNTPDYLLLHKDFTSKSLCSLYSCSIILTNVITNNNSNIKLNCSTQVNNSNSLLKIALANKRTNIPNFIPYLIIPFMLLLT